MRNSRSAKRTGRIFVAAVVSLGLFAAACSKKDDEGTTDGTDATEETVAPDGTDGATETTAAVTETTAAAETPVPGGELVVSGEAEVANPWTPAAMQCDSYCQQRARSFYDPVAAVGADLKVHGVLAESITPNDDATEWTIKIREGISFTDGTPVDGAAVLRNLNESGSGLLISGALVDLARETPGDPSTPFVSETIDAQTFKLFTGKNGDIANPVPWPGFDFYLCGQWGLIASPTYLDAVKADPTVAAQPVGSGPFMVESYAPRDALVVVKNPNYWQKDADGVQLPYLDKITFKVIEDSQTAAQALQDGNIDIMSTSAAQVISDFRELADEFPMTEQTELTETNYLLIDLAKPGPTSDARVRCALSKAIDRTELIDLTAGGILQPANGLFSPGQEGYLEDNGFSTDQDLEGAQALIDEYKAETGATSVEITYGHTADRIGDQVAELLKGYWEQIGVTTKVDVVPQDQFITLALLGDPSFFIYGWRNHAGLKIDGQNFWWNSASGTADGALSLNFGRVNDPVVDAALADARSNPDEAARQAAAETVNKTFAEQCYQIPTSWTLWGTPHKPSVKGLGTWVLPDGAESRDGAGFSGQFWVHTLWMGE
ncbi:MAG: ABC transporter substrate-binding protein [Actinobacteria bacterium]|nr:ABC transporter substrate-binding protein [Actinomycetota bacterium]